MFLLKSHQFVSKLNRMTFSIFDTIRFHSILTKTWTRKTVNRDRKKKTQNIILKGIGRYLCLYCGNSFENWPFSWWLIFCHDCWCRFVSNRIVFFFLNQIRIELNWKVSATSRSNKIESNNRRTAIKLLQKMKLVQYLYRFPALCLKIFQIVDNGGFQNYTVNCFIFS